jgi:hypothetical protein
MLKSRLSGIINFLGTLQLGSSSPLLLTMVIMLQRIASWFSSCRIKNQLLHEKNVNVVFFFFFACDKSIWNGDKKA